MILKRCDLCGETHSIDRVDKWARSAEVGAINYVTGAGVIDLCRECRERVRTAARRAVAGERRR